MLKPSSSISPVKLGETSDNTVSNWFYPRERAILVLTGSSRKSPLTNTWFGLDIPTDRLSLDTTLWVNYEFYASISAKSVHLKWGPAPTSKT